MRPAFAIPLLLLGAAGAAQKRPRPPAELEPFSKQVLTTAFFAEGMTSGDFDGDGRVDLASGPFWWKGPRAQKRTDVRRFVAGWLQRDGAGLGGQEAERDA